jgi:phenol/toluene 2-monooxygenase (NADH) P0/A0
MPRETTDDTLHCDIAARYVRVTDVSPEGLVAFEFSIGWKELMVELVLPEPAFEAFCASNHVQRLTN